MGKQGEIRIFIADDYFLIREGIKKSLKDLNEAVIVGETNDLSNLTLRISETQPDIIIMEISLCERPLKELIQELKKTSPQIKVLVISDCNCELPVIASMRAGISGFIKKNVSKEELIKAVCEIDAGKEYFTTEIAKILAKGYFFDKPTTTNFSDRELEILKYICKGRSNEQLADILFISEKTVATHKRNIMRKAGVKKVSDLILWALNNNIVDKNQ
jgi:DNA-binding NarL/FixJ family response regulator